MKVLIVRADRLGDTILAAPVWQSLKESMPEAKVSFLTREPLAPLYENDPLLEKVYSLPEGGPSEIDGMAAGLSRENFDALVALHADDRVARLVRTMKVPIKGGPLSKPRTWFLFNRAVRQRRSRSILHEADYNGRLLEVIGVSYRPQRPRVHLPGYEEEHRALFERLFGSFTPPPLPRHPSRHGRECGKLASRSISGAYDPAS